MHKTFLWRCKEFKIKQICLKCLILQILFILFEKVPDGIKKQTDESRRSFCSADCSINQTCKFDHLRFKLFYDSVRFLILFFSFFLKKEMDTDLKER